MPIVWLLAYSYFYWFSLRLNLLASPNENFLDVVLQSLDCNLFESIPSEPYLSLENNVLSFHSPNFKKPFSFDPFSGKTGFRLQRYEQEGLLKKALGNLKPGSVIFDATAGLLRDSLILSNLGYQLISIEQSKILGTMLLVGLQANSDISGIDIYIGQAEKCAQEHQFDAIYFDPMFETAQSALRDKNHRIISEILDIECISNNNQNTFDILRKCSFQKLIVKRPVKSPSFDNNINYQIKGKSIRYDVYV